MKQLILLEYPDKENTYKEEDYFVSTSNHQVYEDAITNAGSNPIAIIKGANKSGKTHLSKVWQTKYNAITLSQLEKYASESIYKNCVVEDIDHISDLSEIEALLHIYNNAKENNNMLLMTTKSLDFSDVLPDLSSRLRSTPTFNIPFPDEELLRVIIRKQFYLHQINVNERIVNSIMNVIDRSPESAIEFITILNRETLRTGKKISHKFIQETYLKVADHNQ